MQKNSDMIGEMAKDKKRNMYSLELEPELRELLEAEAATFKPKTTLAGYIRHLIETHPIRQPKKK